MTHCEAYLGAYTEYSYRTYSLELDLLVQSVKRPRGVGKITNWEKSLPKLFEAYTNLLIRLATE